MEALWPAVLISRVYLTEAPFSPQALPSKAFFFYFAIYPQLLASGDPDRRNSDSVGSFMAVIPYAFDVTTPGLVKVVDDFISHLHAMVRETFEIMSQFGGIEPVIAFMVITDIPLEQNNVRVVANDWSAITKIFRSAYACEPLHFVSFFPFPARKNNDDKEKDRSGGDGNCPKPDPCKTIGNALSDSK